MFEIQNKEELRNDLLLLVANFLESDEEELWFPNMGYGHIEEVLSKLGWEDMDTWDTNGWEIDFWNKFVKEEVFLYISGSMYYGHLKISKND